VGGSESATEEKREKQDDALFLSYRHGYKKRRPHHPRERGGGRAHCTPPVSTIIREGEVRGEKGKRLLSVRMGRRRGSQVRVCRKKKKGGTGDTCLYPRKKVGSHHYNRKKKSREGRKSASGESNKGGREGRHHSASDTTKK